MLTNLKEEAQSSRGWVALIVVNWLAALASLWLMVVMLLCYGDVCWDVICGGFSIPTAILIDVLGIVAAIGTWRDSGGGLNRARFINRAWLPLVVASCALMLLYVLAWRYRIAIGVASEEVWESEWMIWSLLSFSLSLIPAVAMVSYYRLFAGQMPRH